MFIFRFILSSFLLFGSTVWAQERCQQLAKTAYEKVYCQIKLEGEGAALPVFEDFQKNTLNVQRLLLSRPARKLNITLPKTSRKSSKTEESTTKTSSRELPVKSDDKPDTAPESATPTYHWAADCQLNRASITCGRQNYRLQENLGNRKLPKYVLTDGFQMELPRYSGRIDDKVKVQIYLGNAYSHYVGKMLSIGLGGSTMSYTRFYHTFFDLNAKKVSFTERFETMFAYLKKDKKALNVQPRLSNQLPSSLKDCDKIDSHLITCDVAPVNWVYVRS